MASSSTIWWRRDWVVQRTGSNGRGTTRCETLSIIQSCMVLGVSGVAQLSRFNTAQINSSVRALQWLLFGWNNACNHCPGSLVDLSIRRP
jgi:hypothetical protein